MAPIEGRAYNNNLQPYSLPNMSPLPDDLTNIKDDMIAFIEGHGMRRFHGFVDYEEVQYVM